MDTIEIFRSSRAAVAGNLRSLADRASDVNLAQPIAPGTSPIGLTLWHIPRTQDWLLNTTIRATPEVADRHLCDLPDPQQWGFGTGLTADEAADVASQVRLPALLAYADEVGAEFDDWLDSISTADLDEVPPLLERQQGRAAYSRPAALAEIQGLVDQPVGVLLQRPAMRHLFVHMGEIDMLLQLAQAATS